MNKGKSRDQGIKDMPFSLLPSSQHTPATRAWQLFQHLQQHEHAEEYGLHYACKINHAAMSIKNINFIATNTCSYARQWWELQNIGQEQSPKSHYPV